MIAIIPARSGSKGLPGKNIKELLGKPLIAYSIEVALQSKYITDVYVSTDDEEIALISKKYGAKVPSLRPSYLSTDDALAIDLYNYILDDWEKNKLFVENFIVLQPTSPLRNVSHINEAVELFLKKDADSVISYTKEDHPVTWHKYINEEGKFEPIFDDKLLNRQDLKTTYYPNGSIYIFNKDLIRRKEYFSSKSFAYIMDKKVSVDIDYQDDFDYAEFLLKKNSKNE